MRMPGDRSVVGLWLAMAALAMQVALGAVAAGPGMADGAGALAFATSVCHVPAADTAPARHKAPCGAACPLCMAIAQAGVLLVPATLAFRIAPSVFSAAPPGFSRLVSARFTGAGYKTGPPRPLKLA